MLPLGTANVLAREIGLPRRAGALATLIAEALPRPVWPGRVGDRVFLMMVGIGFDAEVVAAVDPRLKRRIGRLAFVWAILLRLLRYRGCELSARIDGVEHRAAALIATKGRHYAGPFVIAPEASLTDPWLDLLLFRDDSTVAALGYLCALVLGRLGRLKSVTTLRAQSVSVSAREPVAVQADGELIGRVAAEIGVAAKPVPLIRP